MELKRWYILCQLSCSESWNNQNQEPSAGCGHSRGCWQHVVPWSSSFVCASRMPERHSSKSAFLQLQNFFFEATCGLRIVGGGGGSYREERSLYQGCYCLGAISGGQLEMCMPIQSSFRERERETETETERQRDRQTDRQRDRERARGREGERMQASPKLCSHEAW